MAPENHGEKNQIHILLINGKMAYVSAFTYVPFIVQSGDLEQSMFTGNRAFETFPELSLGPLVIINGPYLSCLHRKRLQDTGKREYVYDDNLGWVSQLPDQ